MMKNMPQWMKTGFLVLGVLFVVWFVSNLYSQFFGISMSTMSLPSASPGYMGEMATRSTAGAGFNDMAMMKVDGDYAEDSYYPLPPVEPEVAPTNQQNRVVITDTDLSLVVKSVNETLKAIDEATIQAQGFVVNSFLSQPSEAATGSIVIRVPSENRDALVSQIKDLGLRVTSENVSGRDVTDQYVDLQERMDVLQKTKAKFEAIQDQAVEIKDLLEVQRELLSVQSQIDSVTGQMKYLEQSAQLSKVSVNLATDALALPLTPDNAWRPALVFRQSVRDMLETLRGLAYSGIRLAVFSVIWIPGLGLLYLGFRVVKKLSKKLN